MAETGPGSGPVRDDDRYDDDELAEALAAQLDSLAATGAIPLIRPRMTAADPGLARSAAKSTVRAPAAGPAESEPESRSQPDSARPPRLESPPEPAPEVIAAPEPEPEVIAEPRPVGAPQPVREPEPIDPPRSVREPEPVREPRPVEEPGARPSDLETGAPALVGAADPSDADPSDAAEARVAAASMSDAVRPDVVPPPVSTQPLEVHTAIAAVPEVPPAAHPTFYAAWERSLRSIGRPVDESVGEAAETEHEPSRETAVLSLRHFARSGSSAVPASALIRPASAQVSDEPAEPPTDLPADAATGIGTDEADQDGIPATVFEAPGARAARPRGAEGGSPVTATMPPPLGSWTLLDDERPKSQVASRTSDDVSTALQPDDREDPRTGRHTAAIPVDAEQIPAAARDRPPRGSRVAAGGFLAGLITWAGALAAPVVLLVGLAIGAAGLLGWLALAVGAALTLPAITRSTVAAARGGTTVGVTRAVFGGRAGSLVALVLVLARTAAAALVLLAAGRIAAAFAARTGIGGGAAGAGLVGVVLVGLLAIAVAAVPGRAGTVVPAALAGLGALVTAGLALVLSSAPGDAAGATPRVDGAVTAALVVGVALGLVLLLTAAEVLPRSQRGGISDRGARSAVAAAICGLGVGVLLAGVGVALGAGLSVPAGSAPESFVGALVDATPSALTGSVAAALVVSSLGLPALLLRAAGTSAAELAGPTRSAPLGAVAAGLIAIALALGALAADLSVEGLLRGVGLGVAVPTAAWAATVAVAPVSPSPRGRVVALIAWVVGSVLGWVVLLAGAGALGRSAALIGDPSGWGRSGALGLAVALACGALGGLARIRRASSAAVRAGASLPAAE